MVDLYVYDNGLSAVGVADKYSEMMWERRFYEAGYFQIVAPFTGNNAALLREGNVLMRADCPEGGLIRYTSSTAGAENARITAAGRFLSWLLHGHVIKRKMIVSGNAEAVMRELVRSVVMNKDSADYIKELRLGTAAGCKGRLEALDVSYIDLHDALSKIARLSGTGFRLTLEPNSGRLVFGCYDGIDRSAEQSENPRVIFSREYDTILSEPTYTVDDSETVNAVVGHYHGEISGAHVAVSYNPTGAKGRELREIVFESDCVTRDLELPGGGTVAELDVEATKAKLLEEAKSYLAAKRREFTAGVAHAGSMKYREAYDLGDVVTVEDPVIGGAMSRRIHKVTENYTAAGTEIIPEFGEISPKE